MQINFMRNSFKIMIKKTNRIPPFLRAEGHEPLELEIMPVIGELIETCRKHLCCPCSTATPLETAQT